MSNQDQESTPHTTPDETYARKVFIITTVCVALYVGSVILFVL
jgi:hypothetical protein